MIGGDPPGGPSRTTMRSAIRIASSMSWVTSTAVMPVASSHRRSTSAWRASRVIASTALSGSSISSTSGSTARALAKPTRCRMPPDSWRG